LHNKHKRITMLSLWKTNEYNAIDGPSDLAVGHISLVYLNAVRKTIDCALTRAGLNLFHQSLSPG
jgi:hypothetical protein